MERMELNDEALESIVGGSICVSKDHTTCGHNCSNQYNVNNYDAMFNYYLSVRGTKPEKAILADMVSMGYITPM